MIYSRLGRCGLKVSALSLGAGNWDTAAMDTKAVREMMAAAMDQGIIYFDNAESYSDGNAEIVMGEALKALGWPRLKYIVSTKFYRGISKGPNEKNTLNRKYLLHGMEASLKRSQLDYVDIAYCHRPDPYTPIEETVWAFHNMIERGQVLYWGTSEWSAQEIEAAIGVAETHHLHKPIVEQLEYNLLNRHNVENQYHRLCHDKGLGLATWSPLAGGTLTGKYIDGVPAGTRAAAMAGLHQSAALVDRQRNEIAAKLRPIAGDFGATLAQLALAWCLTNKNVSTIITGASDPSQITDNVKSLDLLPKLDAGCQQEIVKIIGSYSQSWVGNSPWHYDE